MAESAPQDSLWLRWLRRIGQVLGFVPPELRDQEPGAVASANTMATTTGREAAANAEALVLAAELARCRAAGLSLEEWQRLRFMRWLYRQGRLSEALANAEVTNTVRGG